jgi:hypothetical protein
VTLDPGFRQDGIIVAAIDITRLNIAADQRQSFKRDLLERIRALPGMDSAADVGIVPISGNGWNENLFIEGDENRKGMSFFNRVSPDYFKTMRTVFLAGRDFDNHDTATSPKVAIVNETFVRKFLNGQNPVGVHFREDVFIGRATPMYQIIGFVKDTKYRDYREEPAPQVYVTAAQDDRPDNFRRPWPFPRSKKQSCSPVRRRSLISTPCRRKFAIRYFASGSWLRCRDFSDFWRWCWRPSDCME